MNTYTTKVTKIKSGVWGCRVLLDGKPILEGRAKSPREIGPVLRDLMRTLDKMGGDKYTKSCRERKFKEGNPVISVKHHWL